MIVLADCNNFFVSCETVFNPSLEGAAVIVLSSNDGCVVSRSNQAKALGIKMGDPYFQIKDFCFRHHVKVFSSNFQLYQGLSKRVMMVLSDASDHVEIYSVDEAFLEFSDTANIFEKCCALREKVKQWVGIPISLGIAPTKTLAKVAGSIAKKSEKGVFDIGDLNVQNEILRVYPIGDVWGIGAKLALLLKSIGIRTALQFREMDPCIVRKKMGVIGERLLWELRGVSCNHLVERKPKKSITVSKSFGDVITCKEKLAEALATFAGSAAEKLRRQNSAAGIISVFVVQKEKNFNETFRHGMSRSAYTILPIATSATNELIKAALPLIEKIFTNGEFYKKAGVMLSGIVPDINIQGNLFNPKDNDYKQLMMMVDNVNFSMRDDVLKFASGGTKKNWKMRQELRSPRYKTRWDEIKTVS